MFGVKKLKKNSQIINYYLEIITTKCPFSKAVLPLYSLIHVLQGMITNENVIVLMLLANHADFRYRESLKITLKSFPRKHSCNILYKMQISHLLSRNKQKQKLRVAITNKSFAIQNGTFLFLLLELASDL